MSASVRRADRSAATRRAAPALPRRRLCQREACGQPPDLGDRPDGDAPGKDAAADPIPGDVLAVRRPRYGCQELAVVHALDAKALDVADRVAAGSASSVREAGMWAGSIRRRITMGARSGPRPQERASVRADPAFPATVDGWRRTPRRGLSAPR